MSKLLFSFLYQGCCSEQVGKFGTGYASFYVLLWCLLALQPQVWHFPFLWAFCYNMVKSNF